MCINDYYYYYVVAYKNMSDCMRKHPDASVMVTFASMRSVYESTVEALQFEQVYYIMMISCVV